jgi:hypothetical protein
LTWRHEAPTENDLASLRSFHGFRRWITVKDWNSSIWNVLCIA